MNLKTESTSILMNKTWYKDSKNNYIPTYPYPLSEVSTAFSIPTYLTLIIYTYGFYTVCLLNVNPLLYFLTRHHTASGLKILWDLDRHRLWGRCPFMPCKGSGKLMTPVFKKKQFRSVYSCPYPSNKVCYNELVSNKLQLRLHDKPLAWCQAIDNQI